jgi:hypothetical protein
MAVAAGTTKLTRNHDTLPAHAKPANAVAAHGTGKHTSNLAKIGLLVCGPGSAEVAARPQGGDSTRRGQGSKASGGGCGV